jgi:hypothetical protein
VARPSNGTVVVVGKSVTVSIDFAVPVAPATSWLGADPQLWVPFTAALGVGLAGGGLAGAALVRLGSRRA